MARASLCTFTNVQLTKIPMALELGNANISADLLILREPSNRFW